MCNPKNLFRFDMHHLHFHNQQYRTQGPGTFCAALQDNDISGHKGLRNCFRDRVPGSLGRAPVPIRVALENGLPCVVVPVPFSDA